MSKQTTNPPEVAARLEENKTEFRVKMATFMHDLPAIPTPSAMESTDFARAIEIVEQYNKCKQLVFNLLMK